MDLETGAETPLCPDIDTTPFTDKNVFLKNELAFGATGQSMLASLTAYRNGVWLVLQRIRLLAIEEKGWQEVYPLLTEAPAARAEAETAYFAGVHAMKEKDIAGAEWQWRKAIKLCPLEAAYNNLGTCLTMQGDLDSAIRIWQDALDIAPTMTGLYFNLGTAFARKNELENAIVTFRDSVDRCPGDTRSWIKLGYLRETAGDIDGAITAYEKAVGCDPKHGGSHFSLACLYAARKERDKSIASLRSAVALDKAYVGLALAAPVFVDLRQDPRFGEIVGKT